METQIPKMWGTMKASLKRKIIAVSAHTYKKSNKFQIN